MKSFFTKLILVAILVIADCFSSGAVDGTFYVGEPFRLSNPATPGHIDAIAWYSDKSDYISIDKDSSGASIVITQYFSGTATIECQYGYTYYVGTHREHGIGHGYYTVSCRKSTARLNKTEMEIAPGETFTLSYTNSSGYKLLDAFYSTDDAEVATVDNREFSGEQSVTVKGIHPGTCTITFCANSGEDNPTCTVKVCDIPATAIELSPDTLYLREDKRGSFSVRRTPSGATSPITWESDNESVAKVNSSSGSIQGVSEGLATITATTDNGLVAKGVVKIVPAPTAVTLPQTVTVTLGFNTKIYPTLTPAVSSATYRWSVEDRSVATVDAAGNIFGISAGTTTITVKTDNNLQASATLKVVEPEEGLDVRNVTIKVRAVKNLIRTAVNQ